MSLDTRKIIKSWVETADHSYETAKFLLKGKRYPECLFFSHLMIEKVLKALVVHRIKAHAPHTHKLVDLVRLAGVEISPEQVDALTTITEFNIAGRYEGYKSDFYKKSTKIYAEKYFVISKKLYLWLKIQLSHKK